MWLQRLTVVPDVITDCAAGRASSTGRLHCSRGRCGGSTMPSCRMWSSTLWPPSLCSGRAICNCYNIISIYIFIYIRLYLSRWRPFCSSWRLGLRLSSEGSRPRWRCCRARRLGGPPGQVQTSGAMSCGRPFDLLLAERTGLVTPRGETRSGLKKRRREELSRRLREMA